MAASATAISASSLPLLSRQHTAARNRPFAQKRPKIGQPQRRRLLPLPTAADTAAGAPPSASDAPLPEPGPIIEQVLELIKDSDSGDLVTSENRKIVDAELQKLDAIGDAVTLRPLDNPLIYGNYEVAYVSAGQRQYGQPVGEPPARGSRCSGGGRFRTRLGKLLFATTELCQSILPPDVVVGFRLFGFIPGSVGLRGKLVFFDPPVLSLPAGIHIRVGPPSAVVLKTTYVDEHVRLGKGSRGSLFVFTRGGAADAAGMDQFVLWAAVGALMLNGGWLLSQSVAPVLRAAGLVQVLLATALGGVIYRGGVIEDPSKNDDRPEVARPAAADARLDAAGHALPGLELPGAESLGLAGGDDAPTTALAPPPPPVAPVVDPDKLDYLIISFGNSAYWDMVLNWATSVQRIGTPFLIAAFDDKTLGLCSAHGLPCRRVELGAAGNFRHAHQGRGAISRRSERWELPSGRAFNTGLFVARNVPRARALLASWAGLLIDPARERHTNPSHVGIDDQMAIHLLLEAGGIVGAGDDDPRSILAWNRTLRVQALPVVLFPSGHVAFVQRTPWRREIGRATPLQGAGARRLVGVAPVAIHTTFQRYGTPGKKARLREFGLWHVDPPSYYGASGAPAAAAAAGSSGAAPNTTAPLRLLTYANDIKRFVARAERRRYGGTKQGMPLLEKHWLGMGYQLAVFRDALAAARMLGRVLALPTLWCWCDYDEHPAVLETCRIKGTDLELPFECPLDFMAPVPGLDASGMPYRPAGFLGLMQVPAALRDSRAVIRVAATRPSDPFPTAAHTLGHAATAWPGIKQGDLLRVVRPVEQEAVLVLSGEVPGFLGGFDAPGDSAAFDAAFRQAMLDGPHTPFWCCGTWYDVDEKHRRLHYAFPAPLAGAWQPWEPPRLALPDWCDSLTNSSAWFAALPQHPCAFLRNATAAALAAAGVLELNATAQTP
eukprot:scaffold5.g964.t1